MKRRFDRLVPSCLSGILALAFVVLSGCEETDTRGWLVDRTRVLGARVEALADPARASIAPGEAMRLTWLVGAPHGTGPLSWAYALCAPPIGNFPEPRCQGPVFVSGAGDSNGDVVAMDLEAPAADVVAELSELLVLSAFCEGGAPALDANHFEATCSGGAPARLATATIRLTSAGPNDNPELAPDAVTLDGVTLGPPAGASTASCADEPTAPVVGPATKHAFVLRFRGDERESIPSSDEFESVLASHVVTSGTLERQYSMFEPSEHAPKQVSIEWTAPPRDPTMTEDRIVSLYVVLRDGRGGAAFGRRAICVRP